MKPNAPAPADLQRWSHEVAHDPASLSFVPLARAYRKQGRRDAALKLCMRGLEHHPANVEAHALLALLYFESGHRAKAYDEWSTVLRYDSDHFEALRGMGFFHLEAGDDHAALRSLQRAAQIRPRDLSVQEALKLIKEHRRPAQPAPEPMPWEVRDRWGEPAAARAPAAAAPVQTQAASPPVNAAASVTVSPTQPARKAGSIEAPARPQEFRTINVVPTPPLETASPNDPSRLFEPLTRSGQILGVLLIDAQGLVLAGSLSGAPATRAESLGAILGGTVEEAARTSAHLGLGPWQGILLDSEHALLHLAPVREGAILMLAATRSTPTGWMLRTAHQAAVLADKYLEGV